VLETRVATGMAGGGGAPAAARVARGGGGVGARRRQDAVFIGEASPVTSL
jgi:hypothetical protein